MYAIRSYYELAGQVAEIHVIGDAQQPGGALAAIAAGHEVGRRERPRFSRFAYWEKADYLRITSYNVCYTKLLRNRRKRRYVRFVVGERLQHFVLLVTFFVLVITGFALKYPDASWA